MADWTKSQVKPATFAVPSVRLEIILTPSAVSETLFVRPVHLRSGEGQLDQLDAGILASQCLTLRKIAYNRDGTLGGGRRPSSVARGYDSEYLI